MQVTRIFHINKFFCKYFVLFVIFNISLVCVLLLRQTLFDFRSDTMRLPRFLAHTPKWLIWYFDKDWFILPSQEPVIYLTFDDGPTTEVTDFVLAELAKYDAKATFFMLGKQIESNIELAKEVQSQGHKIANHSYSHPNGWRSWKNPYLADVQRGHETIERHLGVSPSLFRPPYGKIRRVQSKVLRKRYQLVLMSILCGDFDPTRTHEACTETVLTHSKNGSIIVYHDSDKAFPRLKESLPVILAELSKRGFRFEVLPEPVTKN
jgi:peptidoglycan-N-acetylglucosamine deacetylase